MKILIAGANGFIGSHLTKYLASLNKYKVFALVRKDSNLNSLNAARGKINIVKVISSFKSINSAVRKTKPDVVVHLAASSTVEHRSGQVEPLILANILFPVFLAEAMVKNRVFCLVNTGSFWEYMNGLKEQIPVNLYAATKIAFEQILKYYSDAEKLRCVTLKLFGTYGPDDPRAKIFVLLKKSLENKKSLSLSPGRQVLDLVYIDDVVAAYEKAIRYVSKKRDFHPESFFIGSGKGMELREIVGVFQDCIGKPLNIRWGTRPYRAREVMFSKADIRQAKKKLKWQPRYDLRSGIAKMLDSEKLILKI